MVWLALVFAVLVQDPMATPAVSPSSRQPYSRPVVRPFEPPSDFGRKPAEGDEDAAPYRRAIPGPVHVDAYRQSYEVSPDDALIAYEQGVATAERAADALMGLLDGAWSVSSEDGGTMLRLVLHDPIEAETAVEGAWSRAGPEGAAHGLSPVVAATRDILGRVTMDLGDAGVLALSAGSDGGWTGTLTDGDRTHAAVLVRPISPD